MKAWGISSVTRFVIVPHHPKVACFYEVGEGTLWFKDRLVVSRKESLKKKILDEG
jgi:hypothetical protein